MRVVFLLPAALLAALAAFPAVATEELYREKGCMACHDVAKRVVGPAYADVGRKYRALPDGEARVVASILNGSSKKWGPIAMYPNAVTEEEARKLAAWILTR